MAIEWQAEGIILSSRIHGESDSVVSIFTRSRGRHLGLVKGGASRKRRGSLQPGTLVGVRWRARLEEHLGNYACETIHTYAVEAMTDSRRLICLSTICAMADRILPEREPHERLYQSTLDLLNIVAKSESGAAYVKWELLLLAEMGFGLELRSCAATGQPTDLTYVSPKSGQAVSKEAGAPYHNKLLALPKFLLDEAALGPLNADVLDGFNLTGYFLDMHLFRPHERLIPPVRSRFMELFEV